MSKMMMPILLIAGGFMVLAMWRSPATAAQDFGTVLGNAGTFAQEVVSKVAEFLGNLGK
ncbi:unannotated protein [freshwater metagenome]|uniref:Unannotated protein n=1 Tax=freshwater metagenome TaxID=449393 RepID=A0A6J7GGG3_9ZZZZ